MWSWYHFYRINYIYAKGFINTVPHCSRELSCWNYKFWKLIELRLLPWNSIRTQHFGIYLSYHVPSEFIIPALLGMISSHKLLHPVGSTEFRYTGSCFLHTSKMVPCIWSGNWKSLQKVFRKVCYDLFLSLLLTLCNSNSGKYTPQLISFSRNLH